MKACPIRSSIRGLNGLKNSQRTLLGALGVRIICRKAVLHGAYWASRKDAFQVHGYAIILKLHAGETKPATSMHKGNPRAFHHPWGPVSLRG